MVTNLHFQIQHHIHVCMLHGVNFVRAQSLVYDIENPQPQRTTDVHMSRDMRLIAALDFHVVESHVHKETEGGGPLWTTLTNRSSSPRENGRGLYDL